MIFWPHDDDISQPPTLGALRYRRPDGKYWESAAGGKAEALIGFRMRWQRETGNKLTKGTKGFTPCKAEGFSGSRVQGTRRPDHYAEHAGQED